MKTLKKVGTIIISVILWAIILLAALFAFTTLATQDSSHVASIFGYTPMVVQTESMAPTFNAGDLIVIRRCDPAKLAVGDIVTFHTIIENEYALNTHRIAEISTENGYRSYTTRGDNNPVEDQHMISDSDIVGQYVTRVPGMGKVISFLSGSVGFLLVIVLPMLAFFIYQVYHLITVSIKLKKAVAKETAEEEGSAAAEAEKAKAEAEAMRAELEAARAEAQRLKDEAAARAAQSAPAPAADAAPAEPAPEAPAEEKTVESQPAEAAPAEAVEEKTAEGDPAN